MSIPTETLEYVYHTDPISDDYPHGPTALTIVRKVAPLSQHHLVTVFSTKEQAEMIRDYHQRITDGFEQLALPEAERRPDFYSVQRWVKAPEQGEKKT